MKSTILEKTYSGEDYIDISEDIDNAIEEATITYDEHGFAKGEFKLKLIYVEE